eukprot:scaffold129081_cov19-Tisochrysis_lutea.AAC.1
MAPDAMGAARFFTAKGEMFAVLLKMVTGQGALDFPSPFANDAAHAPGQAMQLGQRAPAAVVPHRKAPVCWNTKTNSAHHGMGHLRKII